MKMSHSKKNDAEKAKSKGKLTECDQRGPEGENPPSLKNSEAHNKPKHLFPKTKKPRSPEPHPSPTPDRKSKQNPCCARWKNRHRCDRNCMIVPKSLARPIRYINPIASVENQSYTAPCSDSSSDSGITGTLNHLKEDIITSHTPCHQVATVCESVHSGSLDPVSGLQNVYIQDPSGKFKIAPKSIAMFATLQNTRPCRLEEVNRPGCETALDIAIIFQRLWTWMSRICFGLLAGASLLHLIMMATLMSPTDDLDMVLMVYGRFAHIIPTLFYILLTLCIVSLCDWYDLAHIDTQHCTDIFAFRQTWVVIAIYVVVLLVHLACVHMDEIFMFYPIQPKDYDDSYKDGFNCSEMGMLPLKNSDFEDYNATKLGDCFAQDRMFLQGGMIVWKVLTSFRCSFAIIGWCILAIVRTDDLLLLHLTGLKKYDQTVSKIPA